jgi:D-serine deaminase-like pyridoxal phosphate-dependent protein
LLISAPRVDRNILTTLSVLDGDAGRWRPHVKTAKLAWTMERLMAHGITSFKCATTLELETLAEVGAKDVLVAMPLSIATAIRVQAIASRHPNMSVSALADSERALDHWPQSVGLMIDLNVGMDRTGIEPDVEKVVSLARLTLERGLDLAGLHAYDGHLMMLPPTGRNAKVSASIELLVRLLESLQRRGIQIKNVVTSGSTTFHCAVLDGRLSMTGVRHQVSPGTVVYSDMTTAERLESIDYETAVHVLSRVLSAPTRGVVTCDAGHKAVSADAGVPTCVVVGQPSLTAAAPSEEHLPIRGSMNELPQVGELIELAPRHVCPTVNLFNTAILVESDGSSRLLEIEARGHEASIASH